MPDTNKAVMSAEMRENLPDSAFACPEKRLYPHHHADGTLDLVHLRAALSRIGDTSNDQCGRAHLEAHARAEGIGDRGKALVPVKAQVLGDEEMEAWFAGRIPRRLLAIPFGGPIPSEKAPRGVDLDGEWFSERTDIYGPYKALRMYRERPVDFMHGVDGKLADTMIGKAVLDAEPEEDGWWADLWLKAQEMRLRLVRSLAQRGAQLFGSSQAAWKKADPDTGEITEWPYYIQTIAPTPQNTYSVIRPKAVLDGLELAQIELASPLKAWLADLDALGADLPATFLQGGEPAATAMRLSERMPDLLDAWGIRKP